MPGEAREKCAVSAIIASNPEVHAAGLVYETLYAMQNRGTEASGIASQPEEGSLQSHRERGLVRDVYNDKVMRRLMGSVAVGHNRYSTSGSKFKHPQPFKDPALGMAFAHNGNLPVTRQLETHLSKHNISTDYVNDSEMMGLTLAQYIRSGHNLPDAVELAYPLFRGAFSCVAMHDGLVVAFRDHKGIRPLAFGRFDEGMIISSETCGIDMIMGGRYEQEVEPGQMLVMSQDGRVESKQLAEGEEKLDMFEFVYFARPDSQLYGKTVNEVRRAFGQQLAREHPPVTDDPKNILVIPIPETSDPAAEGYADELGLTKRDAIIKNRYIGRTFMQPSDEVRERQLLRKHHLIPEIVKGKDVIFIDDSIVRLNTLPGIIKQALDAGARSVTVLIASPPVRFPDFYGIDTPRQSELAAAVMTVEQMKNQVNCQYLGFMCLQGMIDAIGISADKFNLSCFTGDYPIGIGHRKNEISTPISMQFVE